jgi:hypothetical protein
MRTEHLAFLAEYARQELALRLGVDAGELVIAYIVPAEFGDTCLGYAPHNARCGQFVRPEPGAIVGIEVGDRLERYSVTRNNVVWHDRANGDSFFEVDEKAIAAQREIREDLAGRLGVDVSEVGVLSFRLVTWPDGCLGVINPAATCIAALTDGYLAFLGAPDGKAYRYHGGDDRFIAVDFEEGITGVTEPLAMDPQAEIIADLAGRLGLDSSVITVQSFENVTWADGCLGVIRPAALCLAGEVDGYLAFLVAPDGTVYRYHGGAGTFVAVDFEEGVSGLQDPVR